jgi:hypothetical protein
MSQYGRCSHPPRPLCVGHDMRVDRSGIAHIVDPPAEKGLYGCSKVKCHHPGCHRSHSSGLHTRRRCLVRGLRGFGGAVIASVAVVAAGRDSSACTGAGRHRKAWEVRDGCGRICGGVGGLYGEGAPRGRATSCLDVTLGYELRQLSRTTRCKVKNTRRCLTEMWSCSRSELAQVN